jgi:hypothetical protein
MKKEIKTTQNQTLVNKANTAVITSVKYSNEVHVLVNYTNDFSKNYIINVNDLNAFMRLRLLTHDLLDDGFKIEWK